MPLAPEALYTKWFKQGSWLYQHFTFLFRNPLWTSSVPSGSSLCVFFWSALFSMFLFRPLVYFVIGLRAIVKVLRLGRLVRWMDRLLNDGQPATFGLPTALALLVLATFGFVLCCIGTFIYEAAEYGMGIPIASLFVIPLTLIPCWIYADCKKADPNRCKVEVYSRAVLGICLAAILLFHPNLFVGAFVSGPLTLVGWVFGLIGAALTGIWTAIKWVIMGIVSGLAYAWIIGGFLLICALYGWFATRWFGSVAGVTEDSHSSGTPKLTARQIRANEYELARYIDWALDKRDIFHGYTRDEIEDAVRRCVITAELCRTTTIEGPNIVTDDMVNGVIVEMEAARARRRNRNALCAAVVRGVTRFFSPVVWVWKQTCILCSYLWAWAKATKSAQCPYIRFYK